MRESSRLGGHFFTKSKEASVERLHGHDADFSRSFLVLGRTLLSSTGHLTARYVEYNQLYVIVLNRATSAAAYQTGQAGYAVTPAATAATYTQRPAAAAATGYETYQAAAAAAATGTTYAGKHKLSSM